MIIYSFYPFFCRVSLLEQSFEKIVLYEKLEYNLADPNFCLRKAPRGRTAPYVIDFILPPVGRVEHLHSTRAVYAPHASPNAHLRLLRPLRRD